MSFRAVESADQWRQGLEEVVSSKCRTFVKSFQELNLYGL